MTCIECPQGCSLSVDYENCRAVNVRGAKCPKGAAYAIIEIEAPTRILTSAVLSEAGTLKMVPVRTNKPIPKSELLRGVAEIKKMRLRRPVRAGDVITDDLLGLGVKLLATRDTAF